MRDKRQFGRSLKTCTSSSNQTLSSVRKKVLWSWEIPVVVLIPQLILKRWAFSICYFYISFFQIKFCLPSKEFFSMKNKVIKLENWNEKLIWTFFAIMKRKINYFRWTIFGIVNFISVQFVIKCEHEPIDVASMICWAINFIYIWDNDIFIWAYWVGGVRRMQGCENLACVTLACHSAVWNPVLTCNADLCTRFV